MSWPSSHVPFQNWLRKGCESGVRVSWKICEVPPPKLNCWKSVQFQTTEFSSFSCGYRLSGVLYRRYNVRKSSERWWTIQELSWLSDLVMPNDSVQIYELSFRVWGSRIMFRIHMRRIAIIVSVPWEVYRCSGRIIYAILGWYWGTFSYPRNEEYRQGCEQSGPDLWCQHGYGTLSNKERHRWMSEQSGSYIDIHWATCVVRCST